MNRNQYRIADAKNFSETEFVEIYVVAKIAANDRGWTHASRGWSRDAQFFDMPELQAEYERGYQMFLDDEALMLEEEGAMAKERVA